MHPFLQRLLARPEETQGATVPSATPSEDLQPGPVPELLHEHDVTPPTLLRLLRQAYLPVESMPGGRLLVTTESGMRLQLAVDAARRQLVMSATYALVAEVDRADKLEFMNRVNDRVVFVRFSLLDETTLYVDHHLPYDGGVTAAAVIGCVRRLGRITPQAIQEFAAPGMLA